VRSLRLAPTSAYDEHARAFRVGSYRGRVGRAELERGARSASRRAFTQKKWVYVALITDELVAAFAIVNLGYASKQFYYVLERGPSRVIAEGSTLAGPLRARVSPVGMDGGATLATFGRRSSVERVGKRLALSMKHGDLDVTAQAEASTDEMTAIAEVPGGRVNVTEKAVLMAPVGTLRVGGRSFDLAGGALGYDHTSGLLARHTSWRWAFAMGKDSAGAPFALNLVSGFVGELECTAWTGGEPHALAEPRIEVGEPAREGARPWRINGDGVDLLAEEHARHSEATNLLLVRSRFIQATGTLRGKVEVDGRAIELTGVPGMIEDQDVLW
jgi:hypothetical protein